MVRCGFIFDVIVVRIDTPTYEFDDPTQLAVDVNFNNVSLRITSSRINVVEFRSGRSYEFDADTDELRTQLAMSPLRLTIKYQGARIGTGQMPWPENVLQKVSDSLGELTHVDECDLFEDNSKIGIVEIIVRLQCKCQEMGEMPFMKRDDNIRNHLDKVINPHDVLFVVGGDGHKDDDDCAGLLPTDGDQEGREPTALDLSPFRAFNGQLVQTPDMLNTCMNDDCCELRKMNQFQELVQMLMCCDEKKASTLQRACRASQHTQECPHSRKFTSSSTRNSSTDCKCPCVCQQARRICDADPCSAFAGSKLKNLCPLVEPPNLMQVVMNTPRRCPVCKANIAWLPKLTACPKCGYKPVPTVEERPYNEQLTADQVLQQYMEKCSSSTEQQTQQQLQTIGEQIRGNAGEDGREECPQKRQQCRCTCKNGKVCAHCRIRKLCEDIFTTESRNNVAPPPDECGKCEENNTTADAYNVCKTSSQDCRPYLARVFSELRDLYEIKEPRRKDFDLNERCEMELQGVDTTRPQRGDKTAKKATTDKQRPDQQHQQQAQKKPQQKESNGPTCCRPSIRELICGDNGCDPCGGEKRRKRCKRRSELDRCLQQRKTNAKKANNCCKSQRYVPSGERPPVPQSSHKTCVNGYAGRKNVPRNMGWLWNVDASGVRRGWKPGAIRKPIKEIMKYFLKDFPADTLRVSQYAYRKGTKDGCPDNDDEPLTQKPTLHICKKNDEYFITLRPLKDPEALRLCADPYLNMKPIQFKITKNPLLVELRKLKRCLKEMGFNKCSCHKPVVECFCRSFLDKKRLEYQLNKECRRRKIPCCTDTLVLSDTTDSDVEFDFGVTPPAGVIKPERLKRPNLVNHGTQYQEGDWNVPPLFPKPLNKYMKLYNCATGDRYDYYGYGGYAGGGGGGGGGGGYAMGGGAGPGGYGPGGGGGFGPGGFGRGGGRGGGFGGRGGRGGFVGGGVGGVGGGRMVGPGGQIIGGRGGPGMMAGGPGGGRGGGAGGGAGGPGGAGGKAGGGPVDMMRYLSRAKAAAAAAAKAGKGGPGGDPAAEARKRRRRALGEIPLPLLCMVDRRGKPVDPCAPPVPCVTTCVGDVCCVRRDSRIC